MLPMVCKIMKILHLNLWKEACPPRIKNHIQRGKKKKEDHVEVGKAMAGGWR